MTKKLESLKTPRFENCRVCAPSSNEVIFLCQRKKAAWYLKKNLAEKISDDPFTIQLTFEPNGLGHLGDDYFLDPKKNVCVVCGSIENLTKHHIIPYSYFKYFPKKGIAYHGYDIVLMCDRCHLEYEDSTFKERQRIAEEFEVPFYVNNNDYPAQHQKVFGLCNAILKYRDQIPPERIKKIEDELKEHFEVSSLDRIDLNEICQKYRRQKNKTPTHGSEVVAKLKSFDEFAFGWRKHFLKHTRPQFMPDGWDVNRRLYY